MTAIENKQLESAIRIERIAVAIRYVGFVVIASFMVLGTESWDWRDIAIIGTIVALRNMLTHFILVTGQTRLIVTPWNFAVYLIEVSAIVYFSGADESDLYTFYILVLVGFAAYARKFSTVFLAGFAFATAYTAVLATEYYRAGSLSVDIGILLGRHAIILLAGWLLGSIASQMRRGEEAAEARAHAHAESDALQQAIFDNTDDPIIVYAEGEGISRANEAACKLLDTDHETLIGKHLREFIFDDGTIEQKAATLVREGELRGEQLIITAAGDERTIRFVTRSFRRDNRVFLVAVAHDITDEKDSSEAHREATKQLESLADELRTADGLRSGLMDATAAKIRSPLSPLLGQLDALIDGEIGQLTTDQLRALQVCRRSAMRILRVVDDAFSRGGEAPAGNSGPQDREDD